MHPALVVRELEGTQKAIVSQLLRANKGLSQVAIVEALGESKSQATISRELKRLNDLGIVEKTGTTRNASFALTMQARWWATPWTARPRVRFDGSRIHNYEPNKTTWLPEKSRRVMADAAAEVNHQLDASTYSREIAERFLIDLSWASSNLEGNTYDLLDTEALIKYGAVAAGKNARETTMILNHKAAIGYMLECIEKSEPFDMHSALTLHSFLMRDLLATELLGSIRYEGVRIGGSAYRPSEDRIELQIAYAEMQAKSREIEDPYEASFFILAGTAYIQPFVDGNKRMGRISCNFPLLSRGLAPMSFLQIDNRSYLSGMLAFYELGDSGLLAQSIAAGYAASAREYAVSTATKSVPRNVHVRERKRIDSYVKSFVRAVLDGNAPSLGLFLEETFKDLPEDEREVAREGVGGAIRSVGPHNSPIFGIDRADAEAFRQTWSQEDAGPKP